MPRGVAAEQASWERGASILRAVQKGLTYREIAQALGVNQVRVSSLARKAYRPAPVVGYMAERGWESEFFKPVVRFE